MTNFAIIFVNLLLIYLLIGLVFGIAFITRGVRQIDPAAKGTSWRFRIIILPGSVALWPVLLLKWIKAKRHDPAA